MQKNRPHRFALSAAYVEVIHDFLVSELMPGDEPVGPHEYRDRGLIASATARPFQSAFGEEFYKTISEKAAALFHSLIANHPFHNGNKRTAALALDLFLQANGWFLMIGHQDMYQLAKDTASYRERGLEHEDILKQIAQEIKLYAVSFRRLKKMPEATRVYESFLEVRRGIRHHPLNQQQPGRP